VELRLDQFEPRVKFRKRPLFVSHSHRDWQQVRPIRNELERRGHNPLLSFLTCLEDDDNDASLPKFTREEGRVDGFADAMLDFRP
jgi:hypothetical protein